MKQQTGLSMRFAGSLVGTLLLLAGFAANAVTTEAGCCTSGVACTKLLQELQSGCDAGLTGLAGTCAAIQGLTRNEWLLSSSDLSPLKTEDKDLAGTYQLTVGQDFFVTNRWLKTDAPGIRSNGKKEISLKKICYDAKQIEISGSAKVFLISVPFQLSFKTQPQNVLGVRGYFGSAVAQGAEKAFFFVPVSADRQRLN